MYNVFKNADIHDIRLEKFTYKFVKQYNLHITIVQLENKSMNN